MAKGKRLDLLVTELGLLPTRQSAQAAIMDGGILVDGNKVTKPGTIVKEQSKIELLPAWAAQKFVSRGGLKLEKALDEFAIDCTERICLDIGASTGGFTDCLLKRGASRVYAIDVGYGQLEWSLRTNPRVTVKERCNARYLTPQDLYTDSDRPATLAVIDVSFISLTKILSPCLNCMDTSAAEIVSLIKPQFEAGKDRVGKGGVVRDPSVHCDVINEVIAHAGQIGLHCAGLTFSPVKGPAGNIEFLALWRTTVPASAISVDDIVKTSHTQLQTTSAPND